MHFKYPKYIQNVFGLRRPQSVKLLPYQPARSPMRLRLRISANRSGDKIRGCLHQPIADENTDTAANEDAGSRPIIQG